MREALNLCLSTVSLAFAHRQKMLHRFDFLPNPIFIRGLISNSNSLLALVSGCYKELLTKMGPIAADRNWPLFVRESRSVTNCLISMVSLPFDARVCLLGSSICFIGRGYSAPMSPVSICVIKAATNNLS